MKNHFITILGLIAAYTVFVIFYPEYALPSDICYYMEDGQRIPCEEGGEAIRDIISVGPGEVEIRFRILDTIMKTFDMEGKKTCQEEMQKEQEKDMLPTEKKHRSEFLTQVWAD